MRKYVELRKLARGCPKLLPQDREEVGIDVHTFVRGAVERADGIRGRPAGCRRGSFDDREGGPAIAFDVIRPELFD